MAGALQDVLGRTLGSAARLISGPLLVLLAVVPALSAHAEGELVRLESSRFSLAFAADGGCPGVSGSVRAFPLQYCREAMGSRL